MKRKHIIQALILLAGAILTVWLMPRKSDTMDYEVNRPWKYPLLTAPFDLPIYPDSVKVQAAIDSINADYIPVYRVNAEADKQMRTTLAEAVGAMEGIDSRTRANLRRKASEIADAGVVDEKVYGEIQIGRLPQIRVKKSRGNVIALLPTAGLRSPKEAYLALHSAFPDVHVHDAFDRARISEAFAPNMELDPEANDRILAEMHLKASAPIGVIQKGERIIDQGEVVTLQLFTVLQTYEQMLAERGGGPDGNAIYGWLGKLLFAGTVFAVLGIYLYFFRRKIYDQIKCLVFIAGMMVAFAAFAFIISKMFSIGLYIVPLTMITIVLTVFFDAGMAVIVTMLATLLCAVVASSPLEFIAMQLIGSLIGVSGLKELSRRSQLVRTAGLIFVGYAVTYVAVSLMLMGSLSAVSPWMFAAMAVNVVFISFAYVLIFLFEHWLGFTSMVGLVELSDINHPLLRELSKECPGTFQHSMAVSNLAAEAAAKVGAKVQLIRAGALYHDIGKIDNPAFFTENQHGVNPHDALDPMQSARIITGHVTAGLRRAEKAKLPKVIRDFIAQHHGRGVARYFYITYCNQHPGEEVDREPFTYVGPNPQTLESSILMMADAVEAASRSLKDYTREAISDLVNRIVDAQVAEGLHSESPLAFRDVQTIKDSFIQRLLTIYHSRIAYPTAKK